MEQKCRSSLECIEGIAWNAQKCGSILDGAAWMVEERDRSSLDSSGMWDQPGWLWNVGSAWIALECGISLHGSGMWDPPVPLQGRVWVALSRTHP